MRNPPPLPEPEDVSNSLKYCFHFEVRADPQLLRRAAAVIDEQIEEIKILKERLKDAKKEN